MLCSRCGEAIAAASKFCSHCGVPLSWRCRSCGHQNPPGGRFCVECGHTSASSSSGPDQVERRQLTVMFVDLVGSTALGTKLDPEDLRDVVFAHHNCVTKLVQENDGHVARYVGDGILVYFGYPRANEDGAECAVRTGLLVVDAIQRLSSPAGPPGLLKSRVGIATGIAVIGAIVDNDEGSQTAVGETPNLAARLQAIAEPSTVVVDEATRRLTGNLFDYRQLGPLNLKGLTDQVTAWVVEKENVIESRFQALRSIQAPLVGRTEETNLILSRWEQVAAVGRGRVVFLTGEAGIGKSRLISVLEAAYQQDSPLPPLRFSCSAQQRDAALYPVIRHIEIASRMERADSMAVRSSKLDATLRDHGATDLDVSLIGDLFSIASSTSGLPADLSARRKKDMVLAAIIRLLRNQTSRGPRIAVFEDLHWADQSTLELIAKLIDEIEQFPLLLVASSRLEFRPPWMTDPSVTVQVLTGLDRQHSALLIDAVSADHDLSVDVIDEIISRSDGVPLHIEELTKSVVEVELELNRVGVRRSALVPASLHASLSARLDRHPNVKEVAQTAAVVGRDFSFDILRNISDLSENVLMNALGELADAGLITSRGQPPDISYSFKHALVQNAAYDSILRDRKRQLHRRVAALFEHAAEGSSLNNAEVLALHYAEAGEPDRSIKYYMLAAEKASGRSALAERVSHLKNALGQQSLLQSMPDSAQRELVLQLQLGRALIDLRGSGSEQVRASYERGRTLSLSLGDITSLLKVYDGLINYHFTHSDAQSLFRCADELRELAGDAQIVSPQSALMSLRAAGLAHFLVGQFHQSQKTLSQFMTDYEVDRDGPSASLASRDMKASMYTVIGMSLTAMGYPESGVEAAMEGVRHAESLDHVVSLVIALRRACVQRIMWRDAAGCAELSQRLLEVNRDYETFLGTREGGFFHSWALSHADDSLGHVEAMRNHIEELDAAGHSVILPFFMAAAAEVYYDRGNSSAASKLLERAFESIEQTGETWYKSEVLRMRALVCSTNTAERDKWLAEALAIARHQGATFWELRAATTQARCWRADGRSDAAFDVLSSVISRMTEGRSTLDFKFAADLLADLKGITGGTDGLAGGELARPDVT